MSTCLRARVGSEAYAIPVEQVREVTDLGDVTPVPGSRPGLLGVRILRGTIVPVVDLALLLGIPRLGQPGSLVVVENEGWRVGFAVAEVNAVGELAEPTEDTRSGLLAGATLTDGELVGVIDVPRAFDQLLPAGVPR